MCWVYKYIEQGVYGTSGNIRQWAIGYYIGEHFEIISYFENENDAINRVSRLNGGQ